MRDSSNSKPLRLLFCTLLMTALLNVLLISASHAQDQQPRTRPPDKPPTPTAALAMLIAQLSNEGIEALRTGHLVRNHPNVASDFAYEPAMPQLARAVIEAQHRDHFIDAYIRWQLTSYQPTLPRLTEKQWEQVIQDLPMIPINPRADDDLIKLLNRGLQAGELSESDQKQINERLELMSSIESNRRALMTPAMELRAWLMKKNEDSLYRQIIFSLEQTAALVQAGWPTGDYGAKTAELFAMVQRDREFTDPQKRRAAAVAQGFTGITRVYVSSARINENRLEVNFENTAIYDFDVRKWVRSMEQQ